MACYWPMLDGHDPQANSCSHWSGKSGDGQTSLICCKNFIGFWFSAINQAVNDSHGSSSRRSKKSLQPVSFKLGHIPRPRHLKFLQISILRGMPKSRCWLQEAQWNDKFFSLCTRYPELGPWNLKRRFRRRITRRFQWKRRNAFYCWITSQKQKYCQFVRPHKTPPNILQHAYQKYWRLSGIFSGSNLTLWKGAKGITLKMRAAITCNTVCVNLHER